MISLILGGTFFIISQNKSGQNLALNSTQSSSNSLTNSANPNSPREGWTQSGRGVSSQTPDSTISSQETTSNSSSSLPNSANSQDTENTPVKYYFKGKIGDLPIRMVLYNFYDEKENGFYFYENQGKLINLKVIKTDFDSSFEESFEGKKTGEFG